MGRRGRGGRARAGGGARAAARAGLRRAVMPAAASNAFLGCRHQLAPIAAGGQRAALLFRVRGGGECVGAHVQRLYVTMEIDAVRRR